MRLVLGPGSVSWDLGWGESVVSVHIGGGFLGRKAEPLWW